MGKNKNSKIKKSETKNISEFWSKWINGGDKKMSKKEQMTQKAASRIQSAEDKSGKNQDFKARAQSAASKNKK